MLLDGLSYLESMVNQTTQHLVIYNTWCENMPGLIGEGASKAIDQKSFTIQSQQLQLAIDNMGEQITRMIELHAILEKNCLTNPSPNEKS